MDKTLSFSSSAWLEKYKPKIYFLKNESGTKNISFKIEKTHRAQIHYVLATDWLDCLWLESPVLGSFNSPAPRALGHTARERLGWVSCRECPRPAGLWDTEVLVPEVSSPDSWGKGEKRVIFSCPAIPRRSAWSLVTMNVAIIRNLQKDQGEGMKLVFHGV